GSDWEPGTRSTPGDVEVWDPATGARLLTVPGLTGWCNGACFSPDGQTLALAAGGEVKLVDAATGQERQRLKGFAGEVKETAFHPGGTRLAVLDETGVRLCNAGEYGAQLLSRRGACRAIAFSKGGDFLAAGGDGGLTVWEARPLPPPAPPAAKPAPEKPPSATPPPDPRPQVFRATVAKSVQALEKGETAEALLWAAHALASGPDPARPRHHRRRAAP